MTLFEALTGGAFDGLTGNIAGNLTKIFPKSQMPRGLPGGGGGAWAVLELTGTLTCLYSFCKFENGIFIALFRSLRSFILVWRFFSPQYNDEGA